MKKDVIIIAEAGVNHNGNLDLAKNLIDVAASAGVDYVKFQTFKAEKLASKLAKKADYQKKNTSVGESQLQMLKKLELSYADHVELIKHCTIKSVQFLSTPFDHDSITMLKKLGIRIGKIPSGEITNLPYLQKMAVSFDNLIMSTGMADLKEIEDAIGVITAVGFPIERLIVLHCNSEYPTPFSDVNLKAMQTIAQSFNVKVGYSDHTEGIEVSVAAVALGACLIEKHFTLDKNMAGPDHIASLEPEELRQLVTSIRHIELALGNGTKVPSPSEIRNKEVARKSIVAACDMEAGHKLTLEDIAVKRPGNGISPMLIEKFIGKVLQKPVQEDELLKYEHFIR